MDPGPGKFAGTLLFLARENKLPLLNKGQAINPASPIENLPRNLRLEVAPLSLRCISSLLTVINLQLRKLTGHYVSYLEYLCNMIMHGSPKLPEKAALFTIALR